MSKGRIISIDYGRARIGLAWSDRMQMLASPLKTVQVKGKPDTSAQILAKELAELQEQEKTPFAKVVVGLPLNMTGDAGPMAEEVKTFVEVLSGLIETPIETWDERLTSLQVERDLASRGKRRKERAKVVDQAAAMLILQSYLDSLGGML